MERVRYQVYKWADTHKSWHNVHALFREAMNETEQNCFFEP